MVVHELWAYCRTVRWNIGYSLCLYSNLSAQDNFGPSNDNTT